MAVVPSAFLGIGEDFVGGADFGEGDCCGFDGAVVAVGVEFEGLAAVGFFDSVAEDLADVGRDLGRLVRTRLLWLVVLFQGLRSSISLLAHLREKERQSRDLSFALHPS